MDFAYSDDQLAVTALARQIFRDRVDDDYHRRGAPAFDAELWQTLAAAGLLGAHLAEADGGAGLGFTAACLVLKEMGAVLAPLPLAGSAVAALALAEAGREALAATLAGGEAHGCACAEPGLALVGERVQGSLPLVPFAQGAALAVAPAGDRLVLLDLADAGVQLEPQTLSNGLPAARLVVDQVARVIGAADAVQRLRQRLQVATAMAQLGVLEEALARTAAYTRERHQFGRPLAAFQAVSQRAANAYIDIEALRASAEGALWLLDAGRDATLEAGAAAWWAAEAGHRVGHTVQHLHGGVGADRDYPIHRFFLWAVQLEFSQGGAAASLAAMGDFLAVTAGTGGRK